MTCLRPCANQPHTVYSVLHGMRRCGALPREEKGVMVRIECGPRDVSRNACVLAVSKKAGEVAEKRTIPVSLSCLQYSLYLCPANPTCKQSLPYLRSGLQGIFLRASCSWWWLHWIPGVTQDRPLPADGHRCVQVGAKLLEAVGAALGRDCALPANRGVNGSGDGGPAKMEIDAVGAGMKRAALSSGDDLGGDFGDLTVEEPEGKSKKHKKYRF